MAKKKSKQQEPVVVQEEQKQAVVDQPTEAAKRYEAKMKRISDAIQAKLDEKESQK